MPRIKNRENKKITELVNEIDKHYTCTENFAKCLYLMALGNDFESVYREVTGEKPLPRLKPIIDRIISEASTVDGMMLIQELIESSDIGKFDFNKPENIAEFPTIKSFIESISNTSSNKIKPISALDTKKLVKLFTIIENKHFEELFIQMGFDELFSNETIRAIKLFKQKNNQKKMNEKELARLINKMFNLQE